MHNEIVGRDEPFEPSKVNPYSLRGVSAGEGAHRLMGAYLYVMERAVLPVILGMSLFVILPFPLFIGLGIALAFAQWTGRINIFPKDKAHIDANGKITWRPER